MHLESRHLQIYKSVKTKLLQRTFMSDFKHVLECFQINPVFWSCSKKLTSNKIKLTGSILFAQTKKIHDVENLKISLSPDIPFFLPPLSFPLILKSVLIFPILILKIRQKFMWHKYIFAQILRNKNKPGTDL